MVLLLSLARVAGWDIKSLEASDGLNQQAVTPLVGMKPLWTEDRLNQQDMTPRVGMDAFHVKHGDQFHDAGIVTKDQSSLGTSGFRKLPLSLQ